MTKNTNMLQRFHDLGIAQLPDFQRDWRWTDLQICKLLESITSGFPVGAVMFLKTGGDVKFTHRKFAVVDESVTAGPLLAERKTAPAGWRLL